MAALKLLVFPGWSSIIKQCSHPLGSIRRRQNVKWLQLCKIKDHFCSSDSKSRWLNRGPVLLPTIEKVIEKKPEWSKLCHTFSHLIRGGRGEVEINRRINFLVSACRTFFLLFTNFSERWVNNSKKTLKIEFKKEKLRQFFFKSNVSLWNLKRWKRVKQEPAVTYDILFFKNTLFNKSCPVQIKLVLLQATLLGTLLSNRNYVLELRLL